MTKTEHAKLLSLLEGKPWLFRQNLEKLLTEFTITEEVPETRTIQQNKAMHMWFEQVAILCRDAGLDAKVVMNNTVSVEMNADIVKGMWKVMQEALYRTTSTTELSKSKQIDHIVDHFVRFFGEKFGLVLPPFPSEETKPTYGNIPHTSIPYPSDYQEPTI